MGTCKYKYVKYERTNMKILKSDPCIYVKCEYVCLCDKNKEYVNICEYVQYKNK